METTKGNVISPLRSGQLTVRCAMERPLYFAVPLFFWLFFLVVIPEGDLLLSLLLLALAVVLSVAKDPVPSAPQHGWHLST